MTFLVNVIVSFLLFSISISSISASSGFFHSPMDYYIPYSDSKDPMKDIADKLKEEKLTLYKVTKGERTSYIYPVFLGLSPTSIPREILKAIEENKKILFDSPPIIKFENLPDQILEATLSSDARYYLEFFASKLNYKEILHLIDSNDYLQNISSNTFELAFGELLSEDIEEKVARGEGLVSAYLKGNMILFESLQNEIRSGDSADLINFHISQDAGLSDINKKIYGNMIKYFDCPASFLSD